MKTGKPKPVMARILEAVPPEWSSWQLAIWFITPTGYLDDKTPLDIMDRDAESVLNALRMASSEVES